MPFTELRKDWVSEQVIDKGVFARFEFEISFWSKSYVEAVPQMPYIARIKRPCDEKLQKYFMLLGQDLKIAISPV